MPFAGAEPLPMPAVDAFPRRDRGIAGKRRAVFPRMLDTVLDAPNFWLRRVLDVNRGRC